MAFNLWSTLLATVVCFSISYPTTAAQQTNSQVQDLAGVPSQELQQCLHMANLLVVSDARNSGVEADVGEKQIIDRLLACWDEANHAEKILLLRGVESAAKQLSGAVYKSAMAERAKKRLNDTDWINVLRVSSAIIPHDCDRDYLEQLEVWEEAYPFHITKLVSPTMFHEDAIRNRGRSFWWLGLESMNTGVADGCDRFLRAECESDLEHLEEMATRFVHSDRRSLVESGAALFRSLNEDWKGHQLHLFGLTAAKMDSPKNAMGVALPEVWEQKKTDGGRSFDLLEDVSSADDARKIAGLGMVDKATIEYWGSREPVEHLLRDQDSDVQIAAIEATARIGFADSQKIRILADQGKQEVRQAAIDVFDWNVWSKNPRPFGLTYLSHKKLGFPILLRAGHDGLNVRPALRQAAGPFGYRPAELYGKLQADGLVVSERVQLIHDLLDADTSLEATEMAIKATEAVIAESLQLKPRGGFLAYSRPSFNLFDQHADRLGPVIENLMSFIVANEAVRLVPTLHKFGKQAAPALDDLLRILEKDDPKWNQIETEIILAIKAMEEEAMPGRERLLGIALSDRPNVNVMAAAVYLDLGGDFAKLMPLHAFSQPVIVKIDPELLVNNEGFSRAVCERLDSLDSRDTECLLGCLGQYADHFSPELSDVIEKKLDAEGFASPHWYLDIVRGIPNPSQCYLRVCQRHLENKDWRRSEVALQLLSMVGDPNRLLEPVVRQLMESKLPRIRQMAQRCYEKVYPGWVDLGQVPAA